MAFSLLSLLPTATHPRAAQLPAQPRRLLHSLQPRIPVAVSNAKRQRRCECAATANAAGPKVMLANGLVDYYEVLGVDDDATAEEIKRAYRSMAKECHPDYLGDKGHNICILLNEAYEVLSDEGARQAYNARLETALADEEDDYTGEPLSKWMPTLNPNMSRHEDPAEDRAVFVDENTCIGCKQCVWHAPGCFRIEPDHGRSRVYAQWLNNEDELQSAIDSCPVNCIHWVKKDDLPALEYVMQNRVERVNVGVMMAGQGQVADVFDATMSFMKERKRKEEAQMRAKRAYSPAQEEARRQAAEQLLQDYVCAGCWSHALKVETKVMVNLGVSQQDWNSKHIKQSLNLNPSQGSNVMHVYFEILAAQLKLFPPSWPAHHRNCHHQQHEDGLKMYLFACKRHTATARAGSLPTILSSPILEPMNDVLLPCMHCCAYNTLKQQMPAQKQQHSKQHRHQHSKTTAEHKHQPPTHTRDMQSKLQAWHCSKRKGLLIYCCGCG